MGASWVYLPQKQRILHTQHELATYNGEAAPYNG